MPITPTSGQSFGLQAKVQAAVDRSSKQKITRDVEEAIGKAESVSPGGFRDRTGLGGSRGGGTGGGGAAAAGGGLLSKFGGGAVKMLGTVALGGTLAVGMFKAMQNASGRLQAVTSILGTVNKLFWKPFGDVLGKALLPYAKDALVAMIEFNKLAQGEGLGVAVLDLAGFDVDLESGLPEFSWDNFVTSLKWLNFVNPLTWTFWISEFAWNDWISQINWGDWIDDFPGWPDMSGFQSTIGDVIQALKGIIEWANQLPGVDIQQTTTNDTTPSSPRAVRRDFESRGGNISTGGGPSGGNPPAAPRPPGISGGPNPGDITVNITNEMDGRRVGEAQRRETNLQLGRIL